MFTLYYNRQNNYIKTVNRSVFRARLINDACSSNGHFQPPFDHASIGVCRNINLYSTYKHLLGATCQETNLFNIQTCHIENDLIFLFFLLSLKHHLSED